MFVSSITIKSAEKSGVSVVTWMGRKSERASDSLLILSGEAISIFEFGFMCLRSLERTKAEHKASGSAF